MTNTTSSLTTAGGSNSAAGDAISNNSLSTSQRNRQVVMKQPDARALEGQTLLRVGAEVGPVPYWAERWGLMRLLPGIDASRRLLEQIGGRL